MAIKVAVDAFKFRQKCVNIQHVIKRQCLPTVYIWWWNRHYAFFEFVQLQSSKGLNTSWQISKRFQTSVIVHSNYYCLRPHSWTAILAVIVNTVFAINLHSKVKWHIFSVRQNWLYMAKKHGVLKRNPFWKFKQLQSVWKSHTQHNTAFTTF